MDERMKGLNEGLVCLMEREKGMLRLAIPSVYILLHRSITDHGRDVDAQSQVRPVQRATPVCLGRQSSPDAYTVARLGRAVLNWARVGRWLGGMVPAAVSAEMASGKVEAV